jgi:hypothetical protein
MGSAIPNAGHMCGLARSQRRGLGDVIARSRVDRSSPTPARQQFLIKKSRGRRSAWPWSSPTGQGNTNGL